MAVGVFLVYVALRGYKRTGDSFLLILAVGFGLATVGGVAAFALSEFVTGDAVLGVLGCAVIQAAGFSIIAYSIVGERRNTERRIPR